MPNITNITPPRVPLTDPRTGLIAREWYLFFLSLYNQTGSSTTSLEDIQKGPPSLTIDDVTAFIKNIGVVLQPSNEGVVEQIAELQKQVQALQVTPPPREFKRSRYGQFLDTTTQVAGAINTPVAITYNTTEVSNGVYIGSPASRVYVDEPTIYNFLFSIQLDKTSGGTGIFWVWPRINGVDVPNSNSQVRIQGNNAEQLVTVGYFFDLKAGDYVEFMFAVDDTSVQMETFPASAFYPAIPSIILTVTNNIEGVQ